MIGIYKITNNITGHYYIGQSIDIEKRFKSHKHRSVNLAYDTPLYLAMRKYGLDNFSLEILEECTKEELNKKEIFWINKLRANKNGNYNVSTTQGGSGGKNMPRAVKQIDPNTLEVINVFPSMYVASQKTGADRSNISQACRGILKTSKGFMWRYVDEPDCDKETSKV